MTTIQLAKQKAAKLNTNTMQRLTADVESLWVYNMGGMLFVGYPVCDPVPHLLQSNMPTYDVSNGRGVKTDIVQPL
jgi:hypothetical protein